MQQNKQEVPRRLAQTAQSMDALSSCFQRNNPYIGNYTTESAGGERAGQTRPRRYRHTDSKNRYIGEGPTQTKRGETNRGTDIETDDGNERQQRCK